MSAHRLFAVILSIVLLAGCTGRSPAPPPETPRSPEAPPAPPVTPPSNPAPPPAVALAEVAAGLTRPVYLTHAGDGSGRLFILEQTGKVRLWKNGALLAEPFLDLTPLVRSASNEQGLLGLAFHPDYARNGTFFVHYSGSRGETVIARYRASNSPDRADPASAQILMTVPQPYANHNGGSIVFGPDGYLYIALGDGGAGGDPQNFAQNLQSMLGKLHRINVSVPTGYRIPADNPFTGGGGRPEIWAYGLRNPWRISFDRATGDLYIGDVGQNAWEEINFQPAGAKGGRNYGWKVFEGTSRYSPGELKDHTAPIVTYGRSEGCSVTGGYVYRGKAIPGLVGQYLYGDYCKGTIWVLAREGEKWTPRELLASGVRISSFGDDESGELYVVDHGGKVFRLVAK